MLLIFVLISLVFSLLFFNGKFSNLKNANLSSVFLPLCAFLLQGFMSFAAGRELFPREPWFPIALFVSYILLFIFIFLNIKEHKIFAILSFFGTLCNFLVISINGFYMPISSKVLLISPDFVVPKSQSFAYCISDFSTKLSFLGDVIYFPFEHFRGFASVGDLLLCLGVGVLVVELMRSSDKEKEDKGIETSPPRNYN